LGWGEGWREDNEESLLIFGEKKKKERTLVDFIPAGNVNDMIRSVLSAFHIEMLMQPFLSNKTSQAPDIYLQGHNVDVGYKKITITFFVLLLHTQPRDKVETLTKKKSFFFSFLYITT
jgi:hypothetical protein